MMQRWEYAFVHWEGSGRGQHRSIEYSHRDPQDKIGGTFPELLKKLGDDGWELVESTHAAVALSGMTNSRATYTFKRPAP